MLKLALTTLVLALSPIVAAAQCGHARDNQSTSQCLADQTWDAATQACVPATTS